MSLVYSMLLADELSILPTGILFSESDDAMLATIERQKGWGQLGKKNVRCTFAPVSPARIISALPATIVRPFSDLCCS